MVEDVVIGSRVIVRGFTPDKNAFEGDVAEFAPKSDMVRVKTPAKKGGGKPVSRWVTAKRIEVPAKLPA